MEDLTGAPATEVIGKGNHEYTYRLYGKRIPCLADTVLRGDQPEWAFLNVIQESDIFKAETYIPHLKPCGVWLSIKVAPIYDVQGNIVGVIDSCRDITDRKQAEELAAADLHAMRRLQQTGARSVQQDIDFDLMLEDFVEAAIAITGADKGNLQLLDARSDALTINAHRGFEEPFLQFFSEVRDDPAVCGEARLKGERVVVEDVTQSPILAGTPALAVVMEAGVRAVQSTPLLSSAGHLLGMLSTHFSQPHRFPERDLRLLDLLARQAADFIERKQAEVALRQAVARYEQQVRLFEGITSSTPDFVYLFDLQGRFLYANRRLLEIWGMQLPDVIGKTCRELGYEQWHHDMHIREIAQVITTKAPIKGEVPFKAPRTGIFGVYEYIFTPVIGPDGEVELIAGTTRDVAERKQFEEKLHVVNERLQEADRRKDEFLAMLAHELRNPLAPIRYAVQMLNMNGLPENQLQKQRDIIDRQISHMGRLLDDLLDVSRITRGKITLKREIVDLRAIARQALDSLLPMIEGRGQHLLHEAPSSPLPVDGDPTRLEQIIRNLLHNANKYTEAGGCIKLSLVLENTTEWRAVVRVSDSGIGITPEMLPLIFEAFVQAEQGLARSQGGLGIGLAMVKSLVQMHGGSVEAHSAGPGHDSEFVIRLPLAAEMMGVSIEVSMTSESSQVAPAKARRILVVDDNEDSAASLGELLTLWGHDIQTVNDAKHALKAAQQWQPEIVLLDIGLPGMDGYEVARRLRQDSATANAFLVALTGYGQEEDRRRAHEAGFNRHMTKPVELDQLQNILHEAQAA